MKNENYSKIYRIIHWLIAICMIFILFTIFLRTTWLEKNNVADIIKNYLSATDVVLTKDQLIKIAKKIRSPMWNWHIYIGYVLTGLFAIRFFLPFLGEMKFKNPLKKKLVLKEKLHYWVYLIYYVSMTITLVTGLIMKFGSRSLGNSLEDIHKLSIYFLLGFIIIHLAGVIIAEFTNQNGIVSRMIAGKDKKEKT